MESKLQSEQRENCTLIDQLNHFEGLLKEIKRENEQLINKTKTDSHSLREFEDELSGFKRQSSQLIDDLGKVNNRVNEKSQEISEVKESLRKHHQEITKSTEIETKLNSSLEKIN